MDALMKSRKTLEVEVISDDAKIMYLNTHDKLTGVGDFTLIREQIDKQIKNNPHRAMAILLLDIDEFGFVNNTLGSASGDLILQKVVQRMLLHIHQGDLLGRKGGDEFISLLQDVDSHEASKRATLMLKTLNDPFFISNQKINISASLGISLYPDDAQCAEDLLIAADFALNQVKETGKSNYRRFTKSLGKRMKYLQVLQKDLHQAITQNELFVLYQPKISTRDQAIKGAEALLRWRHPTLGVISPLSFIPIAEKTGLIVPIGEWILCQACMQGMAWNKANSKRPISVSVNVSARQFQSFQTGRNSLVTTVRKQLKNTMLSPELLELEITESIFMKEDRQTRSTLKKLKDLGVLLSCDDFGVGYSSFSQLKKVPIDILKIDQSLIADIPHNQVDVTIVRSIIAIARQLHIKVIAEGVEHEAQFLTLMDLGCDMVQGNYFSKAVDASKINLTGFR